MTILVGRKARRSMCLRWVGRALRPTEWTSPIFIYHLVPYLLTQTMLNSGQIDLLESNQSSSSGPSLNAFLKTANLSIRYNRLRSVRIGQLRLTTVVVQLSTTYRISSVIVVAGSKLNVLPPMAGAWVALADWLRLRAPGLESGVEVYNEGWNNVTHWIRHVLCK